MKKLYNPILVVFIISVFFSCKTSNKSLDIDSMINNEFQGIQKTENSIAEVAPSTFFNEKTLKVFIDTALAYNFDILISNELNKEWESNFLESKGAFLPSLSVTPAFTMRKFGKYTIDGVGNYDVQFSTNITPDMIIPWHVPDGLIGFQSAWEIDIWGKLKNQKKAAQFRYLASVEGKKLITTAVVCEVAKTYYHLLELDQQLAIIKENSALQEKSLEIIKIQKEAGRANSFNVKQTEAQLYYAKSLENVIVQQILENENYLRLLSGNKLELINRGEPILKQVLPEQIATGVPSDLLNNRTDITQAKLELMAAAADLSAAERMRYPALHLGLASGLQGFNFAKLLNPVSFTYSFLAGLTAPVLQNNTIKASIKRSVARMNAAQFNYNKIVLQALLEVNTNYNKINNFKNVADYKNKEVKSLQEATSISNQLFITGNLNNLDVIIARKSALDAQLEESSAKKEQFFAIIDLYKALGGGWK